MISATDKNAKTEHFTLKWGEPDIVEGAAKIMLGNEWFANAIKMGGGWGKYDNKWIVNTHTGAWRLKYPRPGLGFNTVQDLLNHLEEWYKTKSENKMSKAQLIKEIVAQTVLETLNEATWPEVETKINKWFKLSPGLTGNIKSIEVIPDAGLRKDIILHDKRGNRVALVKGASHDFTDKYLPILGNLLSAVSGQQAEPKGEDIITFK